MRERWTVGQVTSDEWRHRAHVEAQAILASTGITRSVSFDDLVTMMAVAWLQGVDLGSHETLAEVERAFSNMREALA